MITRIDGRPTMAGVTTTANFGTDGRVSGDSGCNQFSGSYMQRGAQVSFGELASTRRACLQPAVSGQETRLLAALRSATTARFERGTLILRGRSGSLSLVARRGDTGGPPREVAFDCAGVRLNAVFDADAVQLSWRGGRDVLAQRPAASGIWYQSARNTFRGKGDLMTWTQGRRTPLDCRPLR